MGEPEGAGVQAGTARRAALPQALKQVREALRVLAGTPRVLRLVWEAHPWFAAALLAIGVAQGLVPLAEMWIFKHLVDALAASVALAGSGAAAADAGAVLRTVGGLLALQGAGRLPEPVRAAAAPGRSPVASPRRLCSPSRRGLPVRYLRGNRRDRALPPDSPRARPRNRRARACLIVRG